MATGDKITRWLGAPQGAASLLAENKYCRIFLVERDGERVVAKEYIAGEEKLARVEAAGIDAYHRLAQEDPALVDCRVLALDEAERLVAMSFVPGERLSDHLRRVARMPGEWPRAAALLRAMGRLLARLREQTTRPGEALDPFHLEYLLHCSGKLAAHPLAGALGFRKAEEEARALWDAVQSAGVVPSMAHGDFVCRNIHVEGERAGVIDFANTLAASHPLNDILNLRQGIANMALPRGLESSAWAGFREGFGPMEFDEAERRFFHEYHRRRWLMLNLGSRSPLRWARAARAMRTFARPWRGVEPHLAP
jgi:tRNA A-37 threonylcarbamoyl transferase component Bud32